MQKIDRLGWTAGIAFSLKGKKFGVRVNEAGILDRVRACLPPGWKPLKSPIVDQLFSLRLAPPSQRANVRHFHLLYYGLDRLARTLDQEELLQTLAGELKLRLAELTGAVGRLSWTDHLAFESYGLKIGIRSNHAEIMKRVPAFLPPGWKPLPPARLQHWFSLYTAQPGRDGNNHLLYNGQARLLQTNSPEALLEALEGELQIYVGEFARQRIFIHAGVVGWKGRAILLPGRSMSGKSTLVAALLRAGASYYSDEFAVLDQKGLVHPYARRLALRPPDKGPIRRLSPEDLGSGAGRQPLPAGLVALARYVPGSTWKPRPLTQGAALLELMSNTLPLQRRPDRVLATLNQMVPKTRIVKGTRGEAQEMAHALLEELEGKAAA